MKKLFCVSASMFIVMDLMAYGYYDSYSSSKSEPSGWVIFFAGLMLVWGVLQIILFFKVWGMTDDVRALKKDHFCETVFESKSEMARFLRKNLVLGNTENVKRTLLKNFIDNVEHGYAQLKDYGYVKDENGTDQWTSFREKNLQESILPYVDNLKKQYEKIGEEVPVYIQRMETFNDYFKLFVKEDLIVEVEKKE
ncbi:hypothetical protein SAMN04487901_1146 [Prevotella communis]|uniref:Uncharacterized protein n=1 Tax=Prevotella communis TaxID=2913614 RepID=A0A1H0IFY7_9BACT|nr:hypothetical protein [Prevotella communis]SDG97136.1 hypothetical protein SAMN04487901_1146 [Prevotella communis]SDO30256.1 hypothetical protein SAMN04487900_11498 [Prevotella communis]